MPEPQSLHSHLLTEELRIPRACTPRVGHIKNCRRITFCHKPSIVFIGVSAARRVTTALTAAARGRADSAAVPSSPRVRPPRGGLAIRLALGEPGAIRRMPETADESRLPQHVSRTRHHQIAMGANDDRQSDLDLACSRSRCPAWTVPARPFHTGSRRLSSTGSVQSSRNPRASPSSSRGMAVLMSIIPCSPTMCVTVRSGQ